MDHLQAIKDLSRYYQKHEDQHLLAFSDGRKWLQPVPSHSTSRLYGLGCGMALKAGNTVTTYPRPMTQGNPTSSIPRIVVMGRKQLGFNEDRQCIDKKRTTSENTSLMLGAADQSNVVCPSPQVLKMSRRRSDAYNDDQVPSIAIISQKSDTRMGRRGSTSLSVYVPR